jgi:hypothetical protein
VDDILDVRSIDETLEFVSAYVRVSRIAINEPDVGFAVYVSFVMVETGATRTLRRLAGALPVGVDGTAGAVNRVTKAVSVFNGECRA